MRAEESPLTDLQAVYNAALPAGTPGAWIRDAIDAAVRIHEESQDD